VDCPAVGVLAVLAQADSSHGATPRLAAVASHWRRAMPCGAWAERAFGLRVDMVKLRSWGRCLGMGAREIACNQMSSCRPAIQRTMAGSRCEKKLLVFVSSAVMLAMSASSS